MLEDLALSYWRLPSAHRDLTAIAFLYLGGAVGVFSRSTSEMQRAPYFALSWLVYLCATICLYLAMTIFVDALVAGYSWSNVLIQLATPFAAGLIVARLSVARSQDAYGHGRMAFLGFIPLANFVLFLAPSTAEVLQSRALEVSFVAGRLGLLARIASLGAGLMLSACTANEGVRRVEAAASTDDLASAFLDEYLDAAAAEYGSPIDIDDATTLLRVEATGRELRYVYEVDAPIDNLDPAFRLDLIEQACADDRWVDMINAGAVIRHVYLRRDGTEIDVVEVSEATC